MRLKGPQFRKLSSSCFKDRCFRLRLLHLSFKGSPGVEFILAEKCHWCCNIGPTPWELTKIALSIPGYGLRYVE